MFPILTTALALILCFLGGDLESEGAADGVSPFNALLLFIVPLGEILHLLAKRNRTLFKLKGLRIVYTLFSAYPLGVFA